MFTFREPVYLWLLIVPMLLIVLWAWRVFQRRRDIRHLVTRRVIPGQQRYATLGELPFWLALVLGSALLIVAVARPSAPTKTLRRAGIDVVILQDASASIDRLRSAS